MLMELKNSISPLCATLRRCFLVSLGSHGQRFVLAVGFRSRPTTHFYGHGPPQPCVFSPIHFPHSSGTEQGGDLIGANLAPYQNSIGLFWHFFGRYFQRRGFDKTPSFGLVRQQAFNLTDQGHIAVTTLA